MAGCRVLLLLCLGLCFVFDHIDANGGINLLKQETNLQNQTKNILLQLAELKRQESALETKFKYAWNVVDKTRIQWDLFNIRNVIDHLENKPTISYQDYLKIKADQKAQYEKEIEEMKKKLEEARIQEKNKEYNLYRKNINLLTAEKQQIEEEYANYIQASKLSSEGIKKVRDQLEQEKEEVIKTLQAAKEKHARAIDALTANSYEGYKPVHIPQQAQINELKHDLKAFITMKDKKKQNEGLLLTKTKLNSLLPILFEKSKFYPETSRQDKEDALAVMEMNTEAVKDDQNRQRKALLQKMENKDLTELSDDEIESLRKINEELAVTDSFQQEVGTRSAYLKGLLQVEDLIQECSDAMEACKQGKIAKFLADAIAEAKNGKLAKMWTVT